MYNNPILTNILDFIANLQHSAEMPTRNEEHWLCNLRCFNFVGPETCIHKECTFSRAVSGGMLSYCRLWLSLFIYGRNRGNFVLFENLAFLSDLRSKITDPNRNGTRTILNLIKLGDLMHENQKFGSLDFEALRRLKFSESGEYPYEKVHGCMASVYIRTIILAQDLDIEVSRFLGSIWSVF